MKILPNGLVEYGITTSAADIWLHVCPGAGCYYYRTSIAAELASAGKLGSIVEAISSNGATTGDGWLVKMSSPWIAKWAIPENIWPAIDWGGLSDSDAGKAAERLAYYALGLYPIDVPSSCVFLPIAEQYRGRDIAVDRDARVTIEVKCDRPAARTGNLFIQRGERRIEVACK